MLAVPRSHGADQRIEPTVPRIMWFRKKRSDCAEGMTLLECEVSASDAPSKDVVCQPADKDPVYPPTQETWW